MSSKNKVAKEPEASRHDALLAQLELALFGDQPKKKPGLLSAEIWWCQHYQWLKDSGYLLLPRYAPDWTPSWQGTKEDWTMCEDGPVARVFVEPVGSSLM
ncbi:hypothetical protein BDN67DRAFT_1014677 [Paxillus ammoniavirescens]|nr:hypothetical protein BDN67DRAFT_1014677 [Paxillus ammoniavirescens]